jgi:outer membrane lipoprotein-sorting protein
MQNKNFFLISLLVISNFSLASCLEPHKNLKNFFNLKSFSADFQQTFYDSNTDKFDGNIILEKPHYLKLIMKQPERTDLIINEKSVYRVDYDLDQAVKYKKENIINQIPAAFLLLGAKDICKTFEKITCTKDKCFIKPKDTSYLTSINLIFNKTVLKEISYINSFGDEAFILLSNFQLKSELSPALFSYNQEVTELIVLE